MFGGEKLNMYFNYIMVFLGSLLTLSPLCINWYMYVFIHVCVTMVTLF